MAAERDRAFREYVSARWPVLVRKAYLLTGDQGRAEDLVQQALVKLWFAWGRVGPGGADGYLRTTVLRLHLSWWRRKASREVPVDVLPEAAGPVESGAEDRDWVRRSLAGLSARQRAVVVLRYAEDLSEAEVADLLGCSVGTVKTLASRGLERLRRAPHPSLDEAVWIGGEW